MILMRVLKYPTRGMHSQLLQLSIVISTNDLMKYLTERINQSVQTLVNSKI